MSTLNTKKQIKTDVTYIRGYVIISFLVAIVCIYYIQLETHSITYVSLGIIILLLTMLPLIIYFFNNLENKLIPLLPLHSIFYLFTFGIPIFSKKTNWHDVPNDIIEYTLFVTIIGLCTLYVGYYFSDSIQRDVKSILIVENANDKTVEYIAWLLFLIYLSLNVFSDLLELPSIDQLEGPTGYISSGLLYILFLDNRLSKSQSFILLFFALPLIFIIKLSSGLLAQPAFFLVFLGLIYWQTKRSLPLRIIFLMTFFIVLLNPIKHQYRNLAWYGEMIELNYLDKMNLFYELAIDFYGNGKISELISSDDVAFNRFSHISTFAVVIHKTPDTVPYWNGESYYTIFSSFIPRFVWPDKPKATIGQDFGHRYDFIDRFDERTSFNLPWLPEFYVNFGFAGVVYGMFLVGVLLRFLVVKFAFDAFKPLESILGMSLIFKLFYAESNLSLMIGGILTTYIFFYILFKLICEPPIRAGLK